MHIKDFIDLVKIGLFYSLSRLLSNKRIAIKNQILTKLWLLLILRLFH